MYASGGMGDNSAVDIGGHGAKGGGSTKMLRSAGEEMAEWRPRSNKNWGPGGREVEVKWASSKIKLLPIFTRPE